MSATTRNDTGYICISSFLYCTLLCPMAKEAFLTLQMKLTLSPRRLPLFIRKPTEMYSVGSFIYFDIHSISCKRLSIFPLSRSRTMFKYLPVWDASTFTTSSGVPVTTIVPPLSPPSGPKSIM